MTNPKRIYITEFNSTHDAEHKLYLFYVLSPFRPNGVSNSTVAAATVTHRYSTISDDLAKARTLTVTPLSSEVSNFCSVDLKKQNCQKDVTTINRANDEFRQHISLKESSLI